MRTNERTSADFAVPNDPDVNSDELFDVLSNARRRFVIACLREHGAPMALADVAAELATWESTTPSAQIPEDRVTSRYIALHHVHVPKMADTGVIEYDRDSNTVALTDIGDEITALGALQSAE